MTTTANDRVGTITALADRPELLPVFYDPLSYAASTTPTRCTASFGTSAPVYYNPRRDLWVVSRYAGRPGLPEEPRADGQRPRQRHGRHPRLLRCPATSSPWTSPTTRCSGTWFAPRSRPGRSWPWKTTSAGQPGPARLLREKGGGDFAVEFALPLVFSVSMRLLGAHRDRSHSSGRITFCAPWRERSASSASPRTRSAPIGRPRSISPRSFGAVARRSLPAHAPETPDVISQILLAGSKGTARRGASRSALRT